MKGRQNISIFRELTMCVCLLVFAGIAGNVYSQTDYSEDFRIIKLDGENINNVELLSRYLQILSVSGQEKDAGLFLKSVCEQNGLHIKQLGDEEGNFNFSASLFPLDSKKPNIILLNHIDVVPAGSLSDWKYPPFEGRIADGEIWGRGALDMKGVGVAQLTGLLLFKSSFPISDLDYNITFLAVSAEEVISDNGASFVVENYLDLLNPVAVFCEGPSGMNNIVMSNSDQKVFGISVADKKPLRINLQLSHNTFAHGASAPVSYPAKDLSLALSLLLSEKPEFILNKTNIGMLKGLGELEKGIVGFVMRHPRIFKPLIVYKVRKDPRMMIFFSNSITLIDYKTVSHSANSIPQGLECRLDCRLLPEQDINEFLHYVKETLNNPEIEIIVADSLSGAKPSPTSGLIYKMYEEAILKNFPTGKVIPAIIPGYSDCIQFRRKGIPSYGSNPFMLSEDHLETFHNFNERIPVSALNTGTKVYYDFLKNVSSLQVPEV